MAMSGCFKAHGSEEGSHYPWKCPQLPRKACPMYVVGRRVVLEYDLLPRRVPAAASFPEHPFMFSLVSPARLRRLGTPGTTLLNILEPNHIRTFAGITWKSLGGAFPDVLFPIPLRYFAIDLLFRPFARAGVRGFRNVEYFQRYFISDPSLVYFNSFVRRNASDLLFRERIS